MTSISQFISELQRRNVFRSGAAYLVAAWLLVQVSDILLGTFAAPAWAMRGVVIALAVGFPAVLLLSWLYEVTTQGVKRTELVSGAESISVHSGRQIDFAIIGVLLVAVALFMAERFSFIDFGTQPSSDLRSIAVLPFENLSGDVEQEYFAEGMTETLITELSKIAALRVISRQSVMRFKDTSASIPEIVRQLNVNAVVKGSALLIEERVRISVQLIEATTDVHLWAESFDREISDVLALHSDVARAIAQEIQIVVTPEEAARLDEVREVNPEAHRLYLLGRYHGHKFQAADKKKAIEYFRQAIEIDPEYAEPFGGLADIYGETAFFGLMPPRDLWERQRSAATRALEIDSGLAIGHFGYATVALYFDWEWEEADKRFRRAISLNPNFARAYNFYAWYLSAMGRTEEAESSIKRALELDPLSKFGHLTASDVYYFSGRYDQAIAKLREALDLSSDNPFALSRLGWVYVQKGMYTEAISNMEGAVAILPDEPELAWMLGHAYAVAGKTAEARKILDDLHRLAEQRYVLPYGFALIHVGLGEHDEALAWLEKAYEERSSWMPFINVEPRLDPLRSDPRLQDLLRRMNLSD
ncbi:MAG: tetratricopeptide repeat protein [Burkholderiales bacterium]|nr:tetratricopeptide repeat protein [Burkholderiales bacterium]